jgi:hypothetical protein
LRRHPLTWRCAPTSPRKRGEVSKLSPRQTSAFLFRDPTLAHRSFTIAA